jgi:hypothetical protein
MRGACRLGIAVLLAACDGSGEGLRIAPIGEQHARVGETFVLDVIVDNPGGASLSFAFSMPDVPDSGAEIYTVGNVGRFRWTPLASHAGAHSCTFTASGGGASDAETVVIDVQGANSAPVFIQPGAGGTYDLSRDPCVAVHVEVKDDDSLPAAVSITEGEPRIDGATMTASGKQADWHWCPTPAQIDASDRYTLVLQARDESHDAVTHEYVIVLRNETRPDCPGGAPQIVSTSPPPPDPLATSLDYRVDAVVTDDRGLKDAPLLYWSTDPPLDPAHPDVTAFRQAQFVADGGDAYHAAIPNLGLAAGETRTIYYVVSATDNDDAEGAACDHRTDSALRQFQVQAGSGDERAGYCAACSASTQCLSSACVAGPAPFCAGDCGSCPAGASCRDVVTVEGWVMSRCAPEGLDCSGAGACTDDGFEDNDTRYDAWPVDIGLYEDLIICPRDQDFFLVSAPASETLDVLIDGWVADTTDIDLQLLRWDGTLLANSAGIGSSEEVAACVAAGEYVIRVYGIAGDTGTYDLAIEALGGSCCADDEFEDNDSYSSATPLLEEREVLYGQVCAGDEDWFEFYADGARRVVADLEIEGGDLDLELYDRDGMRRLARSAGISTSEQVAADLPAAGDYFLRVFGYRGAEGSYVVSYYFEASTGCASSASCATGTVCDGSACVDDACTPGSSTCPSGTFCPDAGGAGGTSDCVDPCETSSECRSGYACKIFAAGGGCAIAGPGRTGDPCTSFRSCAGETICLSSPGWPGGCCARAGCESNAECPAGAVCVAVGGATLGTCLEDCYDGDSLCRLGEGYTCECVFDIGSGYQFACVAPSVSVPVCF